MQRKYEVSKEEHYDEKEHFWISCFCIKKIIVPAEWVWYRDTIHKIVIFITEAHVQQQEHYGNPRRVWEGTDCRANDESVRYMLSWYAFFWVVWINTLFKSYIDLLLYSFVNSLDVRYNIKLHKEGGYCTLKTYIEKKYPYI